MSEVVVVERWYEEPQDLARMQGAEDAVAWCLEQHAVTFLHTFASPDRCRVMCVYRAPDVEAVRVTQRTAGLRVDLAWAARPLGEGALPEGDCFVVERSFPGPLTEAQAAAAISGARSCLDIHRAELARSFLARDGMRMVCVFRAPDAETVRTVNRQVQIPYDKIWAASARLARPL